MPEAGPSPRHADPGAAAGADDVACAADAAAAEQRPACRHRGGSGGGQGRNGGGGGVSNPSAVPLDSSVIPLVPGREPGEEAVRKGLPPDTCLVALTRDPHSASGNLAVKRLARRRSTIAVCIRHSAAALQQATTLIDAALTASRQHLQSPVPEGAADSSFRSEWWRTRGDHEARLRRGVVSLSGALGAWGVLLLGEPLGREEQTRLDQLVERAAGQLGCQSRRRRRLLRCLLAAAPQCSGGRGDGSAARLLASAVRQQCPGAAEDVITAVVGDALAAGRGQREHVLLCVDPDLRRLPWEIVWPLVGCSVSRVPCATYAAASQGKWRWALPPRPRVSLVVNPDGNLPRAEAALRSLLGSIGSENWETSFGPIPGTVAAPPGAPSRPPEGEAEGREWRGRWEAVFAAGLRGDVFVYLGHGAGEHLFSPERLVAGSRSVTAVCFLMGCASAFRRDGGIDTVTALLEAGAPAVVAVLWEVTDGDAAALTEALLTSWLLQGHGGGGGGGSRQHRRRTLPQCVHGSRSLCRLEYLTGAAVVCWGMPL
eukprot:TRINITY_DN19646_c0_g1_i1.p1 TRINITY_DN19646_c0_g1~~TRINITY_DN19646_c0_g1_i1.p1  ORF type:complete len:542 (+),score=99.78 TRINITY_DN19646_c0_g1_i1:81-1706(+)